ncbi:MAG: hypothetical protein J0H29_14395 [Sphingobacteriales bacterium]|nr:hypothetical protein [Sphingobacteriales bacterium]OJY90216.1 MAG: hypothetical protein BGP14_11040 [Sphingobacteriales bacterium 44-15]
MVIGFANAMLLHGSKGIAVKASMITLFSLKHIFYIPALLKNSTIFQPLQGAAQQGYVPRQYLFPNHKGAPEIPRLVQVWWHCLVPGRTCGLL